MDDLDVFCQKNGLEAEFLRNPGPVFEPYRILTSSSEPFDGNISSISVDRAAGRLGNRVYQVTHATIIGRRLGAKEIRIEAVPDLCLLPFDNLGISITSSSSPRLGPALHGTFFHYRGLERFLEPLDSSFIDETLRHHVAPVFTPRTLPSLNSGIISLHFRSGDIFANVNNGGWVPSLYVMPPAAFYIQAVEDAIANRGATEVRIVYEDSGNPAIEVVEKYLNANGIRFISQSSSLIEDWATLLTSSHLVAPFGTFAEAAALLSRNLRTLYSFRHIESHEFLYNRPESLLATVLQGARNVTVLVTRDAGGYIPERGWNGSREQMDLIRFYPAELLHTAKHQYRPA